MSNGNGPSGAAVMIGTPCFGGLLTQGYVESIVDLVQYAGREGFRADLALLGNDAMITRSRNTLVAAFLDAPDLTHLMFVDADIKFQPEALGRLLRLGEEVVAGLYPLKITDWKGSQERRAQLGESLEQATLRYVGTLCEGDELETRDGFATGLYAGTGFMLIRRSALVKMIAAYPELKYGGIHAYPRRPARGEHQYALFDSLIDPATGLYLSEDFAFCHRWRAIGGKVWLDTRSKLTHIGSHAFVGDTTRRMSAEADVAWPALAAEG
ncbi:MAG TPA: hypothetical protein VMU59_13335 [Caulobacteraceae bacterium]|nr:hypothetical protein [Caulobacteraceae bacterium]